MIGDQIEIPVPLQRDPVKELQGSDVDVEAALGDVALANQVQLVGADVLQAQPLGGYHEVSHELFDAGQIALLRVLAQAPDRKVLLHSLFDGTHSGISLIDWISRRTVPFKEGLEESRNNQKSVDKPARDAGGHFNEPSRSDFVQGVLCILLGRNRLDPYWTFSQRLNIRLYSSREP